MAILLYERDIKLAKKVLDYFERNPSKSICRVGIDNKGMVVFLRREKPKLEELIEANK